jgi:hypothetical protein
MNAWLGEEAPGPAPWRDWMRSTTALPRQPGAGGDQCEAQCLAPVRWFVVLGVFHDGLTVQGLTQVRGPYRSARAAARHAPALSGCTVVAGTDPAAALSLESAGHMAAELGPTNRSLRPGDGSFERARAHGSTLAGATTRLRNVEVSVGLPWFRGFWPHLAGETSPRAHCQLRSHWARRLILACRLCALSMLSDLRQWNYERHAHHATYHCTNIGMISCAYGPAHQNGRRWPHHWCSLGARFVVRAEGVGFGRDASYSLARDGVRGSDLPQ